MEMIRKHQNSWKPSS